MSYEFPTIYTALIITLFLTVLLAVAYFVKRKSNSIKKIINNKKKINILEFLPIRGGYSAIIFSINNEEFFFVGHKSGNGNLVQIHKSEKNQENENLMDLSVQNRKLVETKKTENKPLQHVNISDLLALHKKG
tara:strand:- start:115 stop:513 length:399 start_codon:yes stop_codon:yes gene_type:complete